ncbi:MAG: hypothetical protein ACT4NU_10140 [Chromatiales bacterium]
MRLVLILCCLMLVAVIGYEVQHPARSITATSTGPGETPAGVPERGHHRLVFPPLEEFDEVVQRSVFSATRRPHVAAAETAVQQRAAGLLMKGTLNSYVLSGVYVRPDDTLAIFWDRRKKELVKVRVGDPLADWHIKAVEPQRVIVSRGDQEQTLPLERGRGLIPPMPPTKPVMASKPVAADKAGTQPGTSTPEPEAADKAAAIELLKQLQATAGDSSETDAADAADAAADDASDASEVEEEPAAVGEPEEM